MRTAGSPKLLEKRRLDAIALFEDGMAQVSIAKKLRIHDRTVRRWIASYRQEGRKGVAAKPTPGRPPKLTAGQQDMLAKMLDKGAVANGYSTELWTCPRVARVVEKRFGISYHVDHMGRLLKSMGFTPQKPERRARERDEAGIRRWVRRDWSDIKKKPAA
jgi:transposase